MTLFEDVKIAQQFIYALQGASLAPTTISMLLLELVYKIPYVNHSILMPIPGIEFFFDTTKSSDGTNPKIRDSTCTYLKNHGGLLISKKLTLLFWDSLEYIYIYYS